MRAVLDVNVLVSAVLSPQGPPARIVARWLAGEFELVVSEQLLLELERTLAYPKLRERISQSDAAGLVELLRGIAEVAADPPVPPDRSSDPGDDYLLALGESTRALVVSGDAHLLELGESLPIVSPRAFLARPEAASD